VRPHKAQKIDLNSEYICPCRRKGCLKPIILTEAFGCDRCQQIFVVLENGYEIEQLASHYPYKKSWRWYNNRWISANQGVGETYFPVALGVILILLIVWLPLALRSSSGIGIVFWSFFALMLAIIPALMVWLAYRR
jgi:hypothetical protein